MDIKIANILSHHLQSENGSGNDLQPSLKYYSFPCVNSTQLENSWWHYCQKLWKPTGLTVQSLSELVDCGGNLQTLVQDGALPLQTDITRPFHKACQITLGLNILACRKTQCKCLVPEIKLRKAFFIIQSASAILVGDCQQGSSDSKYSLHHLHNYNYKFLLYCSLGYSPMPKFFGLFSKRGLITFLASCFLATEGAGATFFPLAFFPLGCQEKKVC